MKKRTVAALSMMGVACIMFAVPYFNGMGCNYEMTLNAGSAHYEGVCRWGVLHMVETDTQTGSRWVVSARQLSFMNQIIYLVHTRHQLNTGDKQSSLNTYNQQQRGFTVFNYSWRAVSGNEIVIFQTSPHYEVLKAKVDGYIDSWDSLFDNKKTYMGNHR
ncbi:hypothetical protein [Mangrovibacter plantisponsor]|nr:hypothetical protein [Mangrovibacter plantisponsor]